MNWKLIAAGTMVVINAGFGILEIAADRHLKKTAKAKAMDIRPDDEIDAVNVANERLSAYKKLQEREQGVIKHKLETAKKTMRYDARKKEIYANLDSGLEQFKDSIGYDISRNAAIDNYDNGLAAFKESIDYDSNMSTYERMIKEAKDLYEEKKRVLDLAGDNVSDATSTARMEIEKAKGKAVTEAETKIKALKDQVEAESKRLEKIKQSELQKLESQVLNEKTRLQKSMQKDLDILEDELRDARLEIAKDIEMSRTADDIDAIESYDRNKEVLHQQKLMDDQRAADIYESTPHHEKLASWLKKHQVPKWCVAVVGLLPLIPLGYLTFRYVGLVVNIIKVM